MANLIYEKSFSFNRTIVSHLSSSGKYAKISLEPMQSEYL